MVRLLNMQMEQPRVAYTVNGNKYYLFTANIFMPIGIELADL
jgi:hypothetical protein